MKIKVTKEQLDKMILESIDNKINADIEEMIDDTNTEVDIDPTSTQTKGTISFDELLTPGKFFKGDNM